jgi:hypothetical protein
VTKLAVQIGRAGELLASGIIESMGYKTVLCQQASFDMLLLRDDDTHYRVEVKTTMKAKGDPRKANGRATRYSWNTSSGSGSKNRLNASSVDLLCLVAMDVRKCYFKPVLNHGVVRYNRTPKQMSEVHESEQLAQALNEIDSSRSRHG